DTLRKSPKRPSGALIHMQLFLFQHHADHRYLHSFPTRRSSDLHPTGPNSDGWAGPGHESGAEGEGGGAGKFLPYRRDDLLARPRSEEHTSELQSPCKLVCRLLLEKKNTSKNDANIGHKTPCAGG